ncbi:13691_t:CDS:2 [Ambispora gerdemannii]|uniref:13691_t:CDS:1 n=1 Tax=Ambispora gerdemannii TaxID=144530 RepID=A0A9N9FU32_9GLOM|nr:13691_t:CDS:2 [Ambispora gerdemannii]
MPLTRRHQQQLSKVKATEDIPPSSSSDSIDNNNNCHKDKNRRGRSSPSIDTRASMVDVANFINVLKNLHPVYNITPIIEKALNELRAHEEEIRIVHRHNQPQVTSMPINFKEYNDNDDDNNTIANSNTTAADVINMLQDTNLRLQ